MGKETKIGLGVIAVLMTVFGVLLFRQLQASHEQPSRGLGDQTAVKPLVTGGDVTVASDESRITGSKLWDTPAAKDATAPAKIAGGDATDPYAAQAVDHQTDVVAPGARPKGKNPLRQANAEFPVAGSEQPAAAAGDEIVADPLMTVPGAAEPDAADPYAGLQDEIAPAAAPLPANSAKTGNPFGMAPPAAAAPNDLAPSAASDAGGATEPAWADSEPPAADPQNAFEPQPAAAPAGAESAYENEPAYDNAPQKPAAQFDRFESSAADNSIPDAAPAEVPFEAAPADAWRTSAPAAVPAAAAPLAADAGEAAPLPIQDGKYTVQPGDSLWSVSEAVYGTGGYFKALAAHNRAVLPASDKLTVGSQLSVPPLEDLTRDYPSLTPRPRKSAVVKAGATRASAVQPRSGRDVYIVNDGDTLFTIARYELGKATRWAEIYDLNREALGEDFDYLRPGMELVMPAGGAESASQPAAARY